MKKILILAAAAMLLSSPAFAGREAGSFEFGFNSSDAPVGGRYWFNETTAVDVGLGFTSMDQSFTNSDTPPVTSTETVTDFTVAGGVTFIVKDYGAANFFVRPGISFTSMGSPDPAGNSATMFTGTLSLGGEVMLADAVGVNFQHGIGFSSMDSGVDGADSVTSFGTFGANLTEVGVFVRFN